MTDYTVHPFERAGLGTAPYRCTGVIENRFEIPGFGWKPGGTCDYCGTGILYEYHIVGSDGFKFKVGCDCVQRTNSTVEGFKVERLKLAREKRATKVAERRVIRQAEWEKIRAEERAARRDSFYTLNGELATKLEAYNGENTFLRTMQYNLTQNGALTERMVEVVKRLLDDEVRQAGLRLNSKHFGVVGVRAKKVNVRVVFCRKVGESRFGYRSIPIVLVKMETEAGEQLTWFTSSYYDVSDTFHEAAFTVKEHDEYKGIKQTVVQRVTFKD